MRRRCDRCGKRTFGFAVTGDWRTFCWWCLLAVAWEPAQPVQPVRVWTPLDIYAGIITAEEYVESVQRRVTARLKAEQRRRRRASNSQKEPT